MHVSIHSLTQRETHSNNMQYTGETVSIHSLTQRETGQTFLHDLEFALFQSTPSRRGRLFSLRRHSGVWWVSIHSLTQRETRSTLQSECRPVVSIHSLTQRETLHLFYVTKIGIVSIHSLTQRETSTEDLDSFAFLFQSTPSRRGRPGLRDLSGFCGDVSIHSLTQRETKPDPVQFRFQIVVSIHSLTQRETVSEAR